MTQKLKSAKIVYGHFPTNGGRTYHVTLSPMKTLKTIEQMLIKSKEVEFSQSIMDELIDKMAGMAEAKGYQVSRTELSKVNEVYKQI